MPSKNSPLFLVGGAVTLLSLLGLLAFIVYFGKSLQQQDTPDILKAILRMELTRSHAVPIASNPNRLITRDFSTITTYLEGKGWTLKDQFGATLVYLEGGRQRYATCLGYARGYFICTLHS